MKSGCGSLICPLIIFIGFFACPIRASNMRKLDEPSVPGSGEKCIPCAQASPPPPPPPAPCPPPPALPPPPPPPLKPPTVFCPPPPSTYIYIVGPPGNLYPADQYFDGAGRGLVRGSWLLVGVGLISALFLP